MTDEEKAAHRHRKREERWAATDKAAAIHEAEQRVLKAAIDYEAIALGAGGQLLWGAVRDLKALGWEPES